jgi:hypothetical protein
LADRIAEICNFLQKQWPNDEFRLDPISGDASFRRYFRIVVGEQSWILMDAPSLLDDSQRFMAICQAYATAGLQVPQIVAVDLTAGLLLLSDLGNDLLQFSLNDENVKVWYRHALGLLPAVRRVKQSQVGELPTFDSAFLQRELQIFNEWFIAKHLGLTVSAVQQDMIAQVFSLLTTSALAQPQAGMHRDFHSRNLMIQPDQRLAVIDFQDAVLGPVSYDAVSLLKDCYLTWPDALISELRDEFLTQLQQEGTVAADYSPATFKRDFDLMGLQRHIKVLGIFCRLWHRDGKAGYLADLPRVFVYVLQTCDQYSELTEFAKWLRLEVEPTFIKKQA